jgi:hypothetical protein
VPMPRQWSAAAAMSGTTPAWHHGLAHGHGEVRENWPGQSPANWLKRQAAASGKAAVVSPHLVSSYGGDSCGMSM